MATKKTTRTRIPKSSSKTKQKSKSQARPLEREVKIFISAFVSLVLILSFYSPVFGFFGKILRCVGLFVLGAPAYFLPILISCFILHKSIKADTVFRSKPYLLLFSALVLLSILTTINASDGDVNFLSSDNSTLFEIILVDATSSVPVGGGLVGALGIPVMRFFGVLGSRLLLVFAIILLVSFATGNVIITKGVRATKFLWDFLNEKLDERAEEKESLPDSSSDKVALPRKEKASKKQNNDEKSAEYTQIELEFTPEKNSEKRFRLSKNAKSQKPEKVEKVKEVENIEKTEPPVPHHDAFEDMKINVFLPPSDEENTPASTIPTVELSASEVPAEEKIDISSIRVDLPARGETTAPSQAKKEPNVAIELSEEDFLPETPPYEFPPISLLEKNTDKSALGKGVDLREQAKTLIDTLKSFGVEAKVLEVNKGPSITRFEIQPATGVKVSKITGLADDIAMNLAALSVRIEAPIPGKAAVGIEIPNQTNSIVCLREVIDSDAFKSFGAKTAFALGKDITGTPIITDIAKMPHALIAGATGSGKSVCINSLITSIIYKADPKEVKFIMIDPKVVELSVYNGIPHLLIPVVTDPRKAAGALNWAVQEMTKRYKMFADNNVRDIKGYNELATLNGEKALEQIIIIVDELADLMMVAPRDVEDAICRLAQMARAAGMHLVIATQRPSVDVITGVIKANVPSRIAFAVSSQIDSRTILDMGGAEKLLGKGDMLFLPMGASKPTRIQGAFISDKEVERVVEFVKRTDIKYDEDVMEKIESGVSPDKDSDGGDADDLLPQAIEIVVEAGQASASLLQRRLKVGYSRAGRLIDQLEARGIVGPHEGAKPRAVLMSRTEYAEMTMQSQ